MCSIIKSEKRHEEALLLCKCKKDGLFCLIFAEEISGLCARQILHKKL